MTHVTPIERYLGIEATRGPVELLGLHSPDCTHEQVVHALRTRLSRVARHPLGRSVEADEVRLALHAAAAQLMDPRVRAHLLEEPTTPAQVRPESETDGEAQDQTESPIPSRDLEIFRLNAMAMLRRAGGWNRQSMQFVAGLAHASGIPVTELSRALHHAPGARREPGAGEGGAVTPTSRVRHAPSRRNDPTLALVGIIGGLGIVVIVVLGVLSGVMPTRERAPASPDRGTQRPRAELRASGGAEGDTSTSLRVDASNLLGTLFEAHELLEADAGEAAWRFERALEWYAPSWRTLDENFRFEIDARIGEFLRDMAPTSSSWERAFESVASPARSLATVDPRLDVTSAAWSVRFLQELRRDIQPSTRLHDSSVSLLGSVFDGGVPRSVGREQSLVDALEIIQQRALTPELLSCEDSSAMLGAWRLCVREVGDARTRQAMLGEAVGRVLRVEDGISSRRELRDVCVAMLADLEWGVRDDGTDSIA
ncbi:MAG: hypothetical protein ACYTF7_11380, partial [Planctomycetota bacterium]